MDSESLIYILAAPILIFFLGTLMVIYKWIESKSKNPKQFKKNASTTFVGLIVLGISVAFVIVIIEYVWQIRHTFDDEAYEELRGISGVTDVFVGYDEAHSWFDVTVESKNKADFDAICQLLWTKYRQTNVFDYRISNQGTYSEYVCPNRFHPDQQD